MRVMARVLFSIAVLTIATPAWARGDRIDDRSLSAEILNPKMAVIYYYRATVHYYMDRYDDAIADYELAIRLRRNYADAYFNRGLAYSRKGLLRQALGDLILLAANVAQRVVQRLQGFGSGKGHRATIS